MTLTGAGNRYTVIPWALAVAYLISFPVKLSGLFTNGRILKRFETSTTEGTDRDSLRYLNFDIQIAISKLRQNSFKAYPSTTDSYDAS